VCGHGILACTCASSILEKSRPFWIYPFLVLTSETPDDIYGALVSLIDFYADNESTSKLDYVNDKLIIAFQDQMYRDDTRRLFDRFLSRIGNKEPTETLLKLLCWLQYSFDGPDVLPLLESKLLTSEKINSSSKLSSLTADFLKFMITCRDNCPRRDVLDYCVSRPSLLCDVYVEIAENYPLDARYAEDAVAEYLLRNNSKICGTSSIISGIKTGLNFFTSFLISYQPMIGT
jgi:hypothetical protein